MLAVQAVATALVAGWFATGHASAPDDGLLQLDVLSLSERVPGVTALDGRPTMVVVQCAPAPERQLDESYGLVVSDDPTGRAARSAPRDHGLLGRLRAARRRLRGPLPQLRPGLAALGLGTWWHWLLHQQVGWGLGLATAAVVTTVSRWRVPAVVACVLARPLPKTLADYPPTPHRSSPPTRPCRPA